MAIARGSACDDRKNYFGGVDVALRFATLCKPSPCDNGPTRLPLEVGRRNVHADGDILTRLENGEGQ
jgi:hypothetical protein